MTKRRQITRRTALRGLGTALALPWLEAMAPAAAFGRPSAPSTPPRRMAFFYVPNGVHLPAWTPTRIGSDFDLPSTLEPLAAVKDDLLVLSGLTHDKGRANSDGPGDHARAASTFLTGMQAYKTAGSKIKIGVSVDQFAAQRLGAETRFGSLELGCDRGANSGQCDSGYSCAYSHNISWRSDSTPAAKEIDPQALFDRLFAKTSKQDLLQKSVLDFVLEDARRLQPDLGRDDRRKVDEYFTSVREIEKRIAQVEIIEEHEPTGFKRPVGIPKSYYDHVGLMCDLLALAFRTDQTRIATFMMARAGSNRSYARVGVREGHHELSHHGGDPVKHEKLSRIDRFHVSCLARLLERLKSIPEGEGTLLDHCMVFYGSGLSDGNRHNNEDLPILLAGQGGGTLRTGRHVRYDREIPVANLFLSMLDRMGVEAPSFGDGTGRLPYLTG